MKRLLFYILFACFPLGLVAEDLQFVTTLSSPVGTFSQLETADPETVTISPIVNFCNTRASVGRIEINGANAYLQNLTLKSGTSLEGTAAEYRLSNSLAVNNGGSITGKRLMANTMSLSGASSAMSQVNDTLYISSMGVKGAKTNSLTITGSAQTSNTGEDDEMQWSNIYSRDYTSSGSATGKSYTSYLLKSKKCYPPSGDPTTQSCPSEYIGDQTRSWNYDTCSWSEWAGCKCKTADRTNCTSSGGSYNEDNCICTCPSDKVLYNGECIVPFKPRIFDIGVRVNCHYCPGTLDGRKKCGTAGADPNHCYYGVDFDDGADCDTTCSYGPSVISYEFYEGGYLAQEPAANGTSARWLYWEGGTRIGGQMYRYAGGSMPMCNGSDYQAICNKNCSASSSCSYKCLISKDVPGCVNGYYTYGGGCFKSANNAAGTGKVMECVRS